ncbi:MAG: ROK family protein [Chloroflexi bacterium]|nr:ROK family protein [Chloroflexota bacterium]
MERLYGGIEAGGTKFVCAVGTGPDDLRAETVIETTTPDETIGRAIAFLQEQHAQAPLAAIGIASFGPVDLNPRSETFGYITATPKPGWRFADLRGPIQRALGLPVAIDTDVNGAALAEHRWGAAQQQDTLIYLTVGTGIGGGALVHGQLLHGLIHPEMGHILLPRDPAADPYSGFCPYHDDCLEGLAAGPAISQRWGQPAETLPPEHAAWKLEAHYLALGVVSLSLTLSPQRVILGGGVMHQAFLFPMIREEVRTLLNGYLQHPLILDRVDEYIVPPGLGDRAGVLGAIALAQQV